MISANHTGEVSQEYDHARPIGIRVKKPSTTLSRNIAVSQNITVSRISATLGSVVAIPIEWSNNKEWAWSYSLFLLSPIASEWRALYMAEYAPSLPCRLMVGHSGCSVFELERRRCCEETVHGVKLRDSKNNHDDLLSCYSSYKCECRIEHIPAILKPDFCDRLCRFE